MKNKPAGLPMSIERNDEIHVELHEDKAWHITRGRQRQHIDSYRLKDHAMAYARAVAYGLHAELISHDANGCVTRHERASLTYPVCLE